MILNELIIIYKGSFGLSKYLRENTFSESDLIDTLTYLYKSYEVYNPNHLLFWPNSRDSGINLLLGLLETLPISEGFFKNLLDIYGGIDKVKSIDRFWDEIEKLGSYNFRNQYFKKDILNNLIDVFGFSGDHLYVVLDQPVHKKVERLEEGGCYHFQNLISLKEICKYDKVARYIYKIRLADIMNVYFGTYSVTMYLSSNSVFERHNRKYRWH